MTTIQKRIIIAGIKIKLARGEDLEEILESYVNLIEDVKQEIREHFEVGYVMWHDKEIGKMS